MKLSDKEKKICKKYRKKDDTGHVHCSSCPLAVDTKRALCKAVLTKKEWKYYEKG